MVLQAENWKALEPSPPNPGVLVAGWKIPLAPTCPDCGQEAVPACNLDLDETTLGWECLRCGPDEFTWGHDDKIGPRIPWPFEDHGLREQFMELGFHMV